MCWCLVWLWACGPVGSGSRSLGELRVDAELVSYDGQSGAVGVELSTRKPWRRPVTLERGDALSAQVGEQYKELWAEQHGVGVVYASYFTELGSGTTARVQLHRDGDLIDGTLMQLPEPFELDPLSGNLVFGFEDVVLTWSPPASDPMTVLVEGSCIADLQLHIPRGEDMGQLRVAALDIDPWDSDDPSPCTGTATVRRERSGVIDSAFARGGAQGVQSRVMEIAISPW